MSQGETTVPVALDSIIDDVERNRWIFGAFSSTVLDIARATQQVDHKVERLGGRVGQLEETVAAGFAAVDQRFEQVDQRFEQVDQRFEQVDQRLDRVDQRLERMDQRFGVVEDQLRRIDGRIEMLVGYIVRDETKSAPGQETPAATGLSRPS